MPVKEVGVLYEVLRVDFHGGSLPININNKQVDT